MGGLRRINTTCGTVPIGLMYLRPASYNPLGLQHHLELSEVTETAFEEELVGSIITDTNNLKISLSLLFIVATVMIIIIIIEGLSIKHLRVVATTDMEVSTIRTNRRNLRKIK